MGDMQEATRDEDMDKTTDGVGHESTQRQQNGNQWLQQLLGRLDANRKTNVAAVDSTSDRSDSSDLGKLSDTSDTEDETADGVQVPELSRKVLAYKDVLLMDLSKVSSMIKKTHFCQMEVDENSWPDYKEFMYTNYRSKLSKFRRQEQKEGNPSGVGPRE
ncbi:DEAD DEAH box helicase, putative [Babesia ovis]|uniref:DEAD DEAH box helicase, putative n=1 Tax=Babesia ovis TaxID=5869 RepID=A0A9W5TF90_BABOV|nr:DEAD DEAH box helicase, putative [Babesia ovis]